MHNGARGRHDHGHGWPRWPRVGAVPYQTLPLLRFFAYNIRARKKSEKGEGEPGNEAIGTGGGGVLVALCNLHVNLVKSLSFPYGMAAGL